MSNHVDRDGKGIRVGDVLVYRGKVVNVFWDCASGQPEVDLIFQPIGENYFRWQRDLAVSLPPSWGVKEDEESKKI